MSDYYVQLLRRHRATGIIIDTNILVMYFVGVYDPEVIPAFWRTETFAKEDYIALLRMLQISPIVLTTPNIVTETSNLLGQLPNHQRMPCFESFAKGVELLKEVYLPSKDLAATGEFQRFGVTDAGLVRLAAQHLILTEDFRLSNYIGSKGIDIINFNHIRSMSL